MTKQSIEQLQQSINTLQKQLDELKQQPPSKVSMWKPVPNQQVYTIYANGFVFHSTLDDVNINKQYLNTGSCFPTRELAEYYAKKRAARQRLEMLALAKNGMVPYEFKRNKDDLCNFYIGWHEDGNEVRVMDFAVINPGVQYFPTRAAARRVLDAMTDEDLITLFGTANRGGK